MTYQEYLQVWDSLFRYKTEPMILWPNNPRLTMIREKLDATKFEEYSAEYDSYPSRDKPFNELTQEEKGLVQRLFYLETILLLHERGEMQKYKKIHIPKNTKEFIQYCKEITKPINDNQKSGIDHMVKNPDSAIVTEILAYMEKYWYQGIDERLYWFLGEAENLGKYIQANTKEDFIKELS